MSPDLARRLAYPYPGGAFVSTVQPGSMAAQADLQRGDVITAVAGRPVQDGAALEMALQGIPLGRGVDLSVWRRGRSVRLSVPAGAPARR
jgi:serine protease Do